MVFCTHQCLQEFIDDPKKYIDGVFEYVKEIINEFLVNIRNLFLHLTRF